MLSTSILHVYRFVDLSDSTLQHGSTNTSSCCPLAQNNHFLKHGTPETETRRSQERKEKRIRPCKIWHPFRDCIIYRHGKDALFSSLEVSQIDTSHINESITCGYAYAAVIPGNKMLCFDVPCIL